MPTLELTNEQVIQLVKQLPPDQQKMLLQHLLTSVWGTWEELSRYGAARVRQVAAQCGLDWDAMSEAQREAFIDDLITGDRRHLLPLGSYQGISIVTAAEFLALMSTR
ncbi:MAG: hypothetical protein KatS3mg022_0845 [Armatimonadota bacterium]|nr:MAG: hypothetical protein KatS3mg022_0845 [Armatimonadota bacterium]